MLCGDQKERGPMAASVPPACVCSGLPTVHTPLSPVVCQTHLLKRCLGSLGEGSHKDSFPSDCGQ